ncbi:YbfB/YjiJ family MFS transporter [Chitinivorax sp. B]|uniref:YbfB/YjiJ family MFS transporter n=1 Tax=Chitinivorax sp. B TaxID=2502235 RepID=UPI0010F7FEC7|nr:YbfB/YjiJ family MFS transporter [Chitinivorax sp. B]
MSHSQPSLSRILLGGIAAVMIVHGIGRFAYTPLLPLMVEDGLSLQQAGWIASSNYVGYLIGALFTVFYHGQREPWLRGALLVNLLTTFAMPLTQQWESWAILRLLSGISNGLVFVYASAFVFGHMAKAGRVALSGLLYAGVGAGIVLSGLVISVLPLLQGNWQLGWWLSGVACCLVLWPAWQLHEPNTPSSAHNQPHPRAGTNLIWVAMGYGCAGLGYIVSATFLPAIIRATPGLEHVAALSWIIVGIAAIPSSVCWSWLMQRIGELRALLLAYALQAIGVIAPVWIGGLAGALLSAMLLGGTFLGIVVMAMAMARRHDPHGGSRTVGLLTSIYGLAQIIGPLITASLTNRPDGMELSLIIAALSLGAGALLLIKAEFNQAKQRLFTRQLS